MELLEYIHLFLCFFFLSCLLSFTSNAYEYFCEGKKQKQKKNQRKKCALRRYGWKSISFFIYLCQWKWRSCSSASRYMNYVYDYQDYIMFAHYANGEKQLNVNKLLWKPVHSVHACVVRQGNAMQCNATKGACNLLTCDIVQNLQFKRERFFPSSFFSFCVWKVFCCTKNFSLILNDFPQYILCELVVWWWRWPQ